MIEERSKEFYNKGLRAFKKVKYQKALDLFNKSLSFNPENRNTLHSMGEVLLKLGRMEEAREFWLRSSLIKIKRSGEIPSDINSIQSWMEDAKELKENGKNLRALDFYLHANLLSPIVDKEEGLAMHHDNSKLYYEIAVLTFNHLKRYEETMNIFNKAIKLDPNLTIPEDIKTRYNLYVKNRSGEDVIMIFPLNTSNLRHIIPVDHKILVSTKASLVGIMDSFTGSKKIRYTWHSHILITNNGIAFQGSKPICKHSVYYLPLTAIMILKYGIFWINSKAAEIKANISIGFFSDPKTKSGKYLLDFNFGALVEKKQDELLRRTVINLKSLDVLPSWKEYIRSVEYIHKKVYKKVKKNLKKDRAKK